MLGNKGGAMYSGAIGEDDFATTLKEQVSKCGVDARKITLETYVILGNRRLAIIVFNRSIKIT